MRRCGSLVTVLLLTSACGSEAAIDELDESAEACCAFESPIEVVVLDENGSPIAGVEARISRVDGDGTWLVETDATGHATMDPGILGSFAVTVTPPPEYEWASGQASVDTVTTSQAALGARDTFRLARRNGR